jgi:hypothetical protein
MKAIWLILLTMVLFNGFLLTFSMFFPSPGSDIGLTNAIDISNNATLNPYKTPGQMGLSLVSGLVLSGGVSIFSFLTGAVLTMATKNFQYLAAAAIVGFISSLWITSSSVFAGLMKGNSILFGIYTLISITIGIIVAILILGIFTGQDQLGYG